MSRSEPYFTSVTAVTHRLYVLTAGGDIRRVTHMGIRPTGTPVPIITTPDGFRFVTEPVCTGSWLACHLARVRGAHHLQPEPEPAHLDDETTVARGTVPAATVPLSVIPTHRRVRKTNNREDN